MPSHAAETKHEVGVRELHDQLSRYVRHAAEGGEVVVTLRGRPVARLTPMDGPDSLGDPQPPVRPRTRITRSRLLRASGLVSDFVAEQRR